MRILSVVLLVLAAACWAFWYWGVYTIAGQHAYDEMAGIVPFAAGIGGLLLVAVAAGLQWYVRRRSKATSAR